MILTELFELAARRRASDIHLASGEPPRLRIDGGLVALEGAVDLPTLLEPFLDSVGHARLAAGFPAERTLRHGDLAFVGIAFRTVDEGIAATFRLLLRALPPFARVVEGAEPFFRRIVAATQGLVLIVGPTGSGKWTTAASIVDAIVAERPVRALVANVHPGFLLESGRGMVTQVRIGRGETVADALRTFADADPDIVAVDDLPTHEDLRQALALAGAGHLVVANLQAGTPASAIQGLVESAGGEAAALRRALADRLVAVTAQRLLPAVGGGRVPVYEWIANGPAIREAIRSGDDLARAQAEDAGCRTLTEAMGTLVREGRIARDDASEVSPPRSSRRGVEATPRPSGDRSAPRRRGRRGSRTPSRRSLRARRRRGRG